MCGPDRKLAHASNSLQCRGQTAHLPDLMSIPVSNPIKTSRPHTVGVYLPNKQFKESWRLTIEYARELRNMNMADFTNHARDIRLKFTPDPRDIVSGTTELPGQSLGLKHRQLWNGVTITPPKRTKTRCIRKQENTCAANVNYVPPEMRQAMERARL